MSSAVPDQSTSAAPPASAESAPVGSAPPARRRGMPGSAKSMIISMIVVGAACLVWLAYLPRVNSVQRPVTDVAGIAREVGTQQHWDVATAVGLPSGWSPVNVQLLQFEGQKPTWQAGYDGPSGAYAAVLQTKSGDAAWIDQQTGDATAAGTSTIGGVTWQRRVDDAHGQKSLVRSAPLNGLTTVVAGKGEWKALETFAAHLKPRSAN